LLGQSMTDLWLFITALQLVYQIPMSDIFWPSCIISYVKSLDFVFPQGEALAYSLIGGLSE